MQTQYICSRTRVWILAEVATPQCGTAASEACLPPVTWSPSSKVSPVNTVALLNISVRGKSTEIQYKVVIHFNASTLLHHLQTAAACVWSPTAFHTAEETTCPRACTTPSGCPSTRSTTSFCTTCWTPRAACRWRKGWRCGSATTSTETPTWKVSARRRAQEPPSLKGFSLDTEEAAAKSEPRSLLLLNQTWCGSRFAALRRPGGFWEPVNAIRVSPARTWTRTPAAGRTKSKLILSDIEVNSFFFF